MARFYVCLLYTSPGCRSQRRTILDQRFTRRVDRYAMDIRPIRKTVGIRSESTCLLGTVYQIDHARLVFLENIHSQRGFLRIRRTMLSGSRRVHATNQPFRADVLQGRDILVMTIHEDRLIEDYRIPYLLDIFLRSIPLLLPIIHGLYTSEFRILIHRLDTNQATVTSIDLGNHGISQQIKRDGLIAFYTCLLYTSRCV